MSAAEGKSKLLIEQGRSTSAPPTYVARVQIPASRFLSGCSCFPLSSKPTFLNSNWTRNQVDEEVNYYVDVLPLKHYLFIKLYCNGGLVFCILGEK